ncbi:hypothetical protein LTR53_002022, partial [Teratosphaeriaceae sp. CCFEE 6253]
MLDAMCVEMHEDPPEDGRSMSRQTSGADSVNATAGDRLVSPEDQKHIDSLGVVMDEAEILLDRFRRLMAPSLPFVLIEPELSASDLYRESPFLLHAVVTVTYFHDLSKQQTLVKHLMRDVSERILLNNEKNLGILKGLLNDFKTATSKAVQGQAMQPKTPNLEEHRVLAGVFYLTSMLASSFKKIDALSYTKFLDDSLKALEQARE